MARKETLIIRLTSKEKKRLQELAGLDNKSKTQSGSANLSAYVRTKVLSMSQEYEAEETRELIYQIRKLSTALRFLVNRINRGSDREHDREALITELSYFCTKLEEYQKRIEGKENVYGGNKDNAS
ncbi:hypothetical protein M2145_002712 [Lachnospiraceae bacterium PF1-21]|uniref:Mobilization protein n=1 Tax=Ohessyouella blattaphilus TaxID=2949333 RepID=A0ABT1ELM8_9FIRM|nr:hypothetical protein [Ohessyouella blattaphilus]MCP1111593.1 hypothetical protein [Ohessyouella blattaphilus]MCR8564987.1 hypothetical protein [Ohessyouella blattaphilus]